VGDVELWVVNARVENQPRLIEYPFLDEQGKEMPFPLPGKKYHLRVDHERQLVDCLPLVRHELAVSLKAWNAISSNAICSSIEPIEVSVSTPRGRHAEYLLLFSSREWDIIDPLRSKALRHPETGAVISVSPRHWAASIDKIPADIKVFQGNGHTWLCRDIVKTGLEAACNGFAFSAVPLY
jgi:hypothetical protein